MADNLETEIRKALDAKAHELEVPADLASRTLEHARSLGRQSLRQRLRTRRDARRMRMPVTGYPRWIYAGAAAATAVLLFVVGFAVTSPTDVEDEPGPGFEAPVAQAPQTELSQPQGADEVGGGQVIEDRSAFDIDRQDTGGGGTVIADPPVPVPGPVAPGPGNVPPKVIKTADIQVEVRQFGRGWTAANDIASKHGGFVTNSGTEQVRDDLNRGTLTMRVPAAKLDAAVADLRRLGEMKNMRTTGQDVSAQLIDLKARIKSLEIEELQLLDLLGRTGKISEVLEIRERLNSVRQEVETLKAQRKYYEDQVDYATINATIFQEGAEPDSNGGDGILGDAWDTALRIGLTIVAGTVVVLGGLIPLAALALAVWFVVRMFRRRRPA